MLVHYPVREPLGEVRPEYLEVALTAHEQVPAAQDEAGVVHVVVEVVVSEEEVVDLYEFYAHLHELVGRSGPAVEHQFLTCHVHDVAGAEPV